MYSSGNYGCDKEDSGGIKNMLLKGKNAIVTGGSRGIGLAIVKELLEIGRASCRERV